MKGMAIAEGIEELIICADRGDAGEAAARALAKRALAAGVAVRICYPPVEGKDWDECTPEGNRASVLSAPQWEPGPDEEDGKDKAKPEAEPVVYKLFNAAQLLETSAPPRKWAVEGVFPDCEVSLLSGDGGTGKSILGLQLLYASTSGRLERRQPRKAAR